MDREASVILEEMNQTRADLDDKLTRLEARARELRPAAVARRCMPDHAADRALGAALMMIGAGLAWRYYRGRQARRARVRRAFASYGRW